MEYKEPQIACLSGYDVRLVEASGTPLSRLFSLDLSDGKCHRADCVVFLLYKLKGSSKCKQKSIVYESSCQLCASVASKDGIYVGESSRSLYERFLEHLDDASKYKQGLTYLEALGPKP